MEAVSDNHLYFWHIFFGMAGCNNYITKFNASIIPRKISSGQFQYQQSTRWRSWGVISRTFSVTVYTPRILFSFTVLLILAQRRNHSLWLPKKRRRKISSVLLASSRLSLALKLFQADCGVPKLHGYYREVQC